ncbi:interferon-induced GTP-binding -like protein [Labeo rohita]|uniref:Interferon-induced GTP-binding-like protein n=1 Tax=Labeo rohita TaxID=84645 RepID=A0A498MDD0_LABRO|nr:interferon-induced GTP-binding -like protein [Labeo rohita]
MEKVSHTFSQQYEEKIRPCIDTIDNLRSLGVEKDLALPAIAVIGDQSSGKSSVLEALSGVALPRGSGIVTRCPLELKMIRTKDEEKWHGKISYQDKEEDIHDPAEVEKKIREAQDEMAGVGVGISDELISLQITSASVPDLTLIDLPGIARVAVKGQPENIGEQIKRLIRKFITKQETINLVVVPCNVDIATTEALQMAQEEDPEGERTLGILTKPDLVDKGTEGTVVDIVHNEVIHLTKGYMIVRCRGQKEIIDQVTLNEATATENAFFKDHPHFSKLYEEGFATIPKLAEKLTIELVHHIQKSLPRLEEQIEAKLAETQKELEAYGNGPPTDPGERLSFLIDKVTAFIRDTLNLTIGEEIKCAPETLIFPELRQEFAKWNSFLDHSGDTFNRKIEQELDIYETKYRGRELPGFINYKTFEGLVRNQIKMLEEPALKTLKTVSDVVRRKFIQLAQSSFAGFPNLLKIAKTKIEAIKQDKESLAESMLRTQFKMELIVYSQDGTYSQSLQHAKNNLNEDEETNKRCNSLTVGIITDSHTTLREMRLHLESYYKIASKRLADQIPMVIRYLLLQEAAFELQRNMLQLLQSKDDADDLLKEDFDIGQKRESLLSRQKRLTKIEAIKQDKESLAESMLRTQFKMELIVYSQDDTYSGSLQHVQNNPYENDETSNRFNSMSVGIDNHATLHEMRLHLEFNNMIANKRLADQIPMVIRYLLLQEAALELQRDYHTD